MERRIFILTVSGVRTYSNLDQLEVLLKSGWVLSTITPMSGSNDVYSHCAVSLYKDSNLG